MKNRCDWCKGKPEKVGRPLWVHKQGSVYKVLKLCRFCRVKYRKKYFEETLRKKAGFYYG